MSDEKTKIKVRKRYDRLSRSYDTLDLGGKSEEKRYSADLLHAMEGDRIVDLGCGTGAIIPYFAKRVMPGGTVFAIDLSPEMIGVVKKRIAEYKLEDVIKTMAEDAEKLSLPDSFVDKILATYTFTSATDVNAVMKEAYRILKKRGIMVILDTGKPKRGTARIYYPILKPIMRLIGRTHIDRDVLGSAKKCGFFVVKTRYFSGGLVYCTLLEKR